MVRIDIIQKLIHHYERYNFEHVTGDGLRPIVNNVIESELKRIIPEGYKEKVDRVVTKHNNRIVFVGNPLHKTCLELVTEFAWMYSVGNYNNMNEFPLSNQFQVAMAFLMNLPDEPL